MAGRYQLKRTAKKYVRDTVDRPTRRKQAKRSQNHKRTLEELIKHTKGLTEFEY